MKTEYHDCQALIVFTVFLTLIIATTNFSNLIGCPVFSTTVKPVCNSDP